MNEEAKLPQLLEHMILNLRMIYARSTLVEKALAHILASDAGLKTILSNSCRSSPPPTNVTKSTWKKLAFT